MPRRLAGLHLHRVVKEDLTRGRHLSRDLKEAMEWVMDIWGGALQAESFLCIM